MNQKLTDQQIEQAVEFMRLAGQKITGRSLRATLRQRYGVSGNTARLFSLCRGLRAAQLKEPEGRDIQQQPRNADLALAAALDERDRALARAQRAEERETAHQDRWATEIHLLRESVEQLKGERLRRQQLEDQVIRLQRELQGLHSRLARYEDPRPH